MDWVPQRTQWKGEGRLCGQILADAPGTVSATSAVRGSLLECHLSVTRLRVRLLLYIDFSGTVYILCVSYLQDRAGVHVRETGWSVQPQNQVLVR